MTLKLLKRPVFSPTHNSVLGLASGVLLVGSACVTVNVNFPESAVQKATDDYVRDLYRAKERGKAPASENAATPAEPEASPSPSPSPSKKSQKKPTTKSVTTSSIWDLIPSAEAAEADLNFRVDSDKSMKIRDRLAGRLDEVLTQKKAGVLGETNDGLLFLKSPEKLKKLLTKKVETLVADENKDREELYEEVAASNKVSKNRIKDIQKSFARSFQAESPSGTWVQDGDGKWSQKP
jgi:uncharacterized protein YdbL (DUF1318 family)